MKRVIIVDQYGVEQCELALNEWGYYDVQSDEELHDLMGDLLPGDKFEVVETESEEE